MADLAYRSFYGGMVQNSDPSKISADSYFLGNNIRVREASVEVVDLPLDITQYLPLAVAKVQGIYSAFSFLVVFADGKAFYRDMLNGIGPFSYIATFGPLDSQVDRIYVQAVPASSLAFSRRSTSATADVELFSTVTSSYSCLVVQDGINQPWLIFSDGSCRVSKTYGNWTTASPEYIPIGTRMFFDGQRLYVANGKSIYRSVSGRPLDFMVNIDSAGNAGGDVTTTSHTVGSEDITCIRGLPGIDGFYVGTLKSSTMVVLNRTKLLFGEPTFDNRGLLDSGAVSQYALADVSSDTGIITQSGVVSLNASESLNTTSTNDTLNFTISKLLRNIVQNNGCAIPFDDYTLFSVDTVYGAGVLVYDKTIGKFVSLDLYDIPLIQQFVVVQLPGIKELYGITTTGIYKMFAGSKATGVFVTRELFPSSSELQLRARKLSLNLSAGASDGTISAKVYAGRKLLQTFDTPLVGVTVTTEIPYGDPDDTLDVPLDLDLRLVIVNSRISAEISWNTDAKLDYLNLICDEELIRPGKTAAKDYDRFRS